MISERIFKHLDVLVSRYPNLDTVKSSIKDAYLILEECYMQDKKALH